MINIPSAIIQRNVLFLEIQCGYHYLGPLLTCLYRHCVKWTVTIPWHLPHLKCWKTKLSRKGKMDVFPSTMLLRFSSEFRFRQMLAEKILQVLCGINHTDLNSMLPLQMCFLSDGTGKDDICGTQLQLRNNQHHLGYHIYARGEIPSRKTHQKITFIHPANI